MSSLPSPSVTSTTSISTSPITSQSLFTLSPSPIATITQPSVSSSSTKVVQPSVHLSSIPILPSVSQASRSGVTGNHFAKHTAISSTFLLSTRFTFKYTSVGAPMQTSTDSTSSLAAIATAIANRDGGTYIYFLLPKMFKYVWYIVFVNMFKLFHNILSTCLGYSCACLCMKL